MIAEKNKSLYATVFMALTLAHAAPVHDAANPQVPDESSSDPKSPSGPVIQFGLLDSEHPPPHSAMQVTSSTTQKDTPFSRQAKLAPLSDEFQKLIPSRKDAKSLADYVVSLKNYIESLDEEDFENFIEHYLETSSDEEKFALDLALDLGDSDSDFDSDDYPLWSDDEDDDDDTSIEFVPSQKTKSDGKALELGTCTKADFEAGKCVSVHGGKSNSKMPMPPSKVNPRHGIFSHYLSGANKPPIDGFNPGENRTGALNNHVKDDQDILNPVETMKPVEIMLSSDGINPDAKGKTLIIIPTVTKRGLFSFMK